MEQLIGNILSLIIVGITTLLLVSYFSDKTKIENISEEDVIKELGLEEDDNG